MVLFIFSGDEYRVSEHDQPWVADNILFLNVTYW